MRVLVVDDDQEIRDTLGFMFEDAGYVVDSAADGIHALEALRNNNLPTVVLLDLMMPRLDGIGVLQTVAGEPDLLKSHAFILMTASHRTFSLPFVNLLSTLSVTMLQKPPDIDVLLNLVEKTYHRLTQTDTIFE